MASIFDLISFENIEADEIQNDDEMTVIPLVGPKLGDIAKPSSLIFERTTTYGSMQFLNQDKKPAIVPSHFMVRGPSAQDHAMSGSGVVIGKQSRTFNDSCCIEQSQGGYLRSQGNVHDVLPITLRKALLSKALRHEQSYQKLWPSITVWLGGLNLSKSGQAHLNFFYNDKNVKEHLEQFAAAFEPVQNQIGAIIFFGRDPVGFEIMSSHDHWMTYWKYLIRGCYGAELLRLKMLGKIAPTGFLLPELSTRMSEEKMSKTLETFTNKLTKEMVEMVGSVPILKSETVDLNGHVETKLITTDRGGGDVVLQDSKPVYVSLVL